MPGLEIIDGTGAGYSTKVNKDNQLSVIAVSESEDRYVNRLEGTVWSVDVAGINPSGANDKFFYLKNTGTTTLAITDFRFSSTVATRLTIMQVSGTPSLTGGADATTTSRNLIYSAKTPSADIKTMTSVTGLSDDGNLFYMELPVANTLYHVRTSSNIIIPQGKSIAISRVAASGILTGIISVVDLNGA